jgi:acyl-CoA synthetase (AMP-forming)/AMP-acid ligase II
MTYFPNLQTVAETIRFHAERTPDAIAILCEERRLTYAELHRASNQVAHALIAKGLGRGARVAYLGRESEHYYAIFFGCAKSETVLVPINWRLAPAEVAQIVRDSGSELVFVEPEFRAIVEQRLEDLPKLREIVELGESGSALGTWSAAYSEADLAPLTGPDDPILQLYTSGTTGVPKGVVLAQRSFYKIRDGLAEQSLDWIDWRPDDVSLVGIPGFHVAGIWWAMQAFNAGVPSVVMPHFRSSDAARLIREQRITTTLVVPAMMHMILSEPRRSPDEFQSLRKVAYGGSPISESLLQESLEVFQCELVQLYGLTESGNAAICLPANDHVSGSPRMRAAGKPLPGVTVQVVDASGREVPLGTVGEILLRTPAVMLEYWGLAAASQETLAGGWLHTGDAGFLDQDGYLFISDRIKDTIIVAGENVYPAEVENALCKHPAVAEAAVIGVPDERWGEAVHAFVALRGGQQPSPRELMLSLRGLIADFKIPRRYEFIDSVPRNPSGKILRRVLREKFWAHMERNVT